MKQRLTAKEEEIMNIFWKNGEMFIRDVLNHIPEPKPNYNTVATQIKFLEDKGFLTRKPVANTFLYCPVISEKEYSGSTISTVVKNYYNNSYNYGDTETTTTITTEVQPYSPMLWQVYIEREDE